MNNFIHYLFGMPELSRVQKISHGAAAFRVSMLLKWSRRLSGRLVIVCGLCGFAAQAQTQVQIGIAPLTLRELLDRADNFYPALRAARVESQASTEDSDAVRRQRWPVASMTSETSTGNLRVYPNKVFQVQQTLWDFGLVSSRIAEAEAAADVSFLDVNIQRQELFLQITSAWQAFHAGRARRWFAAGTLVRLEFYKDQMMRRVNAEASPRIDLELVEARLLQTQVEHVAAMAAERLALTRLENLTGVGALRERVEHIDSMPSLSETHQFTSLVKDADWYDVAVKSLRVAKARAKVKQAEQRFETKKAEALPQIYARIYKPLDVTPFSNDTSTTAFVGLSYTTGNGFSTMAEAKALGTRISAAQLSVESERLAELQTLQSDQEEYINSRLRVDALEKAVMGSELVLASYKRQFEAGKKTWLDLLNAVREVAQNEYSLAEARASMLGAMSRLQLRMSL